MIHSQTTAHPVHLLCFRFDILQTNFGPSSGHAANEYSCARFDEDHTIRERLQLIGAQKQGELGSSGVWMGRV